MATAHYQKLLQTVLKLALLIAAATIFQKSAAEFGLGPYFTLSLLFMGCVAIWNGIVLRQTHPRAASLVEKAGIALVFLTFNMLMASLVPKGSFLWCLPVLCFRFPRVPKSAAEFGLGPYFTGYLLSMGCVAIWNGIVLRKTRPRIASLVEKAGIALVFLAFNMLLASLVPKGSFVWCFPVLCFGFICIPLVLVALSLAAA